MTPTPVATSPVVVQGSRYEGRITLASGATTSFNMTLIARALSGNPSLTGNFGTGNGLTGTVQGTLTGTLDNGQFSGSLIADANGHIEERQYSGPVTDASAAWTPGACVQGCTSDGLAGAVQTTQVPSTPPNAPPPPAPCSYAITPTSASFSGSGGTGSVTVTTASSCAWVAEALSPWITIVGTATGTGVGTVTFTVQANPGAARDGSLRIAGQTYAVAQTQTTSCTYTLNPTAQSVPSTGGSFTTALTTSCSWTASSDVPWITVSGGASGTTSGTISYAVTSNPDPSSRTGHLSLQGPGGSSALTVTQAGTACTYTLNPAGQSVVAGGGAFSTALTTSCAWTASSDVPWITIVSPASGSTSATIAYAVGSNPGTAARAGHVTVQGSGGSATLTVTQSGPASITVNPATAAITNAAQSGLTATVSASVSWAATSDSPWLTITAGGSGGAGTSTLTYAATANTGTPSRIGIITMTGGGALNATLTVTQAGQCTYVLQTVLPVPSSGGSFTGSLTTSCSWTASSDVPWMAVSPSSGTTGGPFTYIVQSNSGAARSGRITVQGAGGSAQIVVSQVSPCTYTLNPAAQSVSSAGGSFTTSLTEAILSNPCFWTASSDVSWITNLSPASGQTSTTITYAVASNPGTARTGHLTVTGPDSSATLTVTQSTGINPLITVNPASAPVNTAFHFTGSGFTPNGFADFYYIVNGTTTGPFGATGIDSSGAFPSTPSFSGPVGSYEAWWADRPTGIESNHVFFTITP